MSSTFESSPSRNSPSHPVASMMMLDSNTGNTCAALSLLSSSTVVASSLGAGSQISMINYSNSGGVGTNAGMTFSHHTSLPMHQHGQSSNFVYAPSSGVGSMAGTSVGGESSSTTSSISSSQNRLQHFDVNELAAPRSSEMAGYNAGGATSDHYKAAAEDVIGAENEVEPIARDRSNTWPTRRAVIETQTSPLIHEQIPEEDSLYGGSDENLQQAQSSYTPTSYNQNQTAESQIIDEENDQFLDDDMSPGREDGIDEEGAPGSKKSATRRNAWGNMSYADLITQAILSSPDQRLTLSQVYEWMVQNVPYFRDKGDSNSSAGWKNSIRHNLSLHSRFMRIQNEGAGKSSWWVINPEAKPGRNPRRRAATMETSTKVALEKKRRGARKRVELGALRGSTQALNDSVAGSQLSMVSQDIFNDGPPGEGLGPNFERFRARTQSNLSMPGGSASSPHYDEFEYPPWVGQNAPPSGAPTPNTPQHQISNLASNVNEILDRTDQMRLDSADSKPDFRQQNHKGVKEHSTQSRASPLQLHHQSVQIKQEDIKSEPLVLPQPPSYQDHNMMTSQHQQMRPLMHSQTLPHMMQQSKMMSSANNSATPPPPPHFYQSPVYSGVATSEHILSQTPPTSVGHGPPPPHWLQMQQQTQQMIYHQNQPNQYIPTSSTSMMMGAGGRMHMMGGQQLVMVPPHQQQELPGDLKNLANLDASFMDCDLDEVMRTL